MPDGPVRIRRSNSCTPSMAPFPIASTTASLSSYHEPHSLGGNTFPATYTSTHNNAMQVAELDDENNSNSNNNNNNNNNSDSLTEDESDRTVVPTRKTTAIATTGKKASRRRRSVDSNEPPELSKAQKAGCFNYIQRRHSIALAFASSAALQSNNNNNNNNWELAKTKHGVAMYKSTRSRCEVRAVTRVNASVKNVMTLLAAGETTESFAYAQRILLGDDNVLDASVLAQCVPSTTSRYFHCGLKHLALKNPFGLAPLDLVFLDYTDVTTTPDNKLVGYRIMESIRVPEFGAVAKYVRASLRCEVYIVRETADAGVVEVTFASHLDPKTKSSTSKRSMWLDSAGLRLSNLRSYAEKASFSHKRILEAGTGVRRDARPSCSVCTAGFAFLLRKRHNCRLCGDVACGRCSRKLPVLVDTVTTRVRVCLRCIIDSRHDPDELGRSQFGAARRGSVGNATYIAYDERDADEFLRNHDVVRNEVASA